MARPEDRDWEQIVEGIELHASDADLAAAEAALREVEPEALRPGLVDAVVARAHAESAALAAPAVDRAPMRLMPRLRRVAAAAVAMLWGSKAVAATALTVVLVTTTVLIVQRSRDMEYSEAIAALRENSPLPMAASAMGQVTRRVQFAIQQLQIVRDSPSSSPALARAAKQALQNLAAGADPHLPLPPVDIDVSATWASDASLPELDRLHYVATTEDLIAHGILALSEFWAPELVVERATYLKMLRRLLSK